MRSAERAVVVAVLIGVGGCSGGTAEIGAPEGAPSPEGAVEVFLQAAREAVRARGAGELPEADRAYERMAAVFGTERGSIRRSHDAEEVHDRMVVLAACLRPREFRILSQYDPESRRTGRTTVTVEITRSRGPVTLPLTVIRGREDRWFIERIDMSSFSC